MSPMTGRIVEIFVEDGVTKATVDFVDSPRIASLFLLLDARVGDEIAVDSDVAIPMLMEEEAVL